MSLKVGAGTASLCSSASFVLREDSLARRLRSLSLVATAEECADAGLDAVEVFRDLVTVVDVAIVVRWK